MADYLTDSGYKEGEKIRSEAIRDAKFARTAASVAAAILNAQELVENFRKQRDIMRRGRRISEALHNKMKQYYWPKELEYLKDANNPDELEAINVLGNRYAGRIKADVAKLYNEKMRKLKCSLTRHCKSAKEKIIQDMMMERARAMANAMILGYKMAHDEWQAMDDLNLERRLQAIGLGQGLVNKSGSFMQKSAGAYANSMGRIAGSFNSSLQAIGYSDNFGDNINYHAEAMQMAGGVSSQATLRDGTAANNLHSAGRYGLTMPDPLQASSANLGLTATGVSNVGPAASAFGYDNSLDTNTSQLIDTGGFGRTVDGVISNPLNSEQLANETEQKNPGIVGNRSLARYGKHMYYDFDSHGKMMRINVDMEHFDLLYSDPDSARRSSGI